MIRTDIGQDGVAKRRKLEKVELKINKAFFDLKFNHSCKFENLIPSSLKFPFYLWDNNNGLKYLELQKNKLELHMNEHQCDIFVKWRPMSQIKSCHQFFKKRFGFRIGKATVLT